MAGRKGQIQRVAREGTARDKAWTTIRKYYSGGFTVLDLLRVIEEARESNLGKWLHALTRHGYLAVTARPVRGATGRTRYRLAREGCKAGLPVVCDRCGRPVMGSLECVLPLSESASAERSEAPSSGAA